MGKLKELLLGSRFQQIDRELMIEEQINNQYDEYCSLRSKWNTGDRNAEMQTIKEWEYLNKPSYEQR